jgi:hypothetical protein
MLTRKDLEQVRERTYTVETVPHPDPAKAAHGVTEEIRLRNMFAHEWLSLMRSMTKPDGTTDEWRNQNYSALVLAFCLVDESGKRILQDDDLNAHWWKTQSQPFVVQSIEAAMRHSGLRAAVTVEDAKKNLPETSGSETSIELPNDSAIPVPEIVSTTLV